MQLNKSTQLESTCMLLVIIATCNLQFAICNVQFAICNSDVLSGIIGDVLAFAALRSTDVHVFI